MSLSPSAPAERGIAKFYGSALEFSEMRPAQGRWAEVSGLAPPRVGTLEGTCGLEANPIMIYGDAPQGRLCVISIRLHPI